MCSALNLYLSSLLLTGLLHYHVEGILCEQSLKFGENHSLQLNISSPLSLCYQLNQTTQKQVTFHVLDCRTVIFISIHYFFTLLQALRVYAASDDAVMDHPVLVTARQCKGVTSWSVPFVESG